MNWILPSLGYRMSTTTESPSGYSSRDEARGHLESTIFFLRSFAVLIQQQGVFEYIDLAAGAHLLPFIRWGPPRKSFRFSFSEQDGKIKNHMIALTFDGQVFRKDSFL